MIKYIIIVFSIELILFIDSTKKNRIKGRYDFLSLVQSWPISSYWNYQKQWITRVSELKECVLSDAACSALQRNSWIVHGLWPDRYNGKNPAFCSRGKKPYDPKLINETLSLKLKEKWPSYCTNLSEEHLWQFEWEKHGSCVRDVSILGSIPNYFSEILGLIEHYDIEKILEKNSIVPGDLYNLHSIIRAIKEELSVDPIIKCETKKNDDKDDEQYLYEIRICINKSFILQDCNHSSHRCNSEENILYPKLITEDITL